MCLCAALLVSEGIDNKLAATAAIAGIESDVQAAKNNANDRGIRKTKKRDYESIAKNNLFGPLNTQILNKGPELPVKPIVKTPLTLIGTFIVDGNKATAILEDQKKKVQDVFAIGEMVFGEAKLISIKSDRVQIERGGQIEELALDENANEKSSGSAEFKDGIAIVSDTEVHVQEVELDKALENLPLLLTQARAVPYFKDGKSIGLRLFAVKQGSIFERLGLRNGDILKSINGNPLGDLSQAIKLFETLKQERSINVAMERERADKEVNFQIK